MRMGIQILVSVMIFGALISSQGASAAQVHRVGTYSCSLLIKNSSPISSAKPSVDIRKQEIIIPVVAQNENDWQAYTEAFDGIMRTVRKKIAYPVYFTTRLVPNATRGDQSLELELGIQMFNKMAPSKMRPVVVSTGSSIQFETPGNHLIRFSCYPDAE